MKIRGVKAMFKKLFKSKKDKGTEIELAKKFNEEIKFRNFNIFIQFYADKFEIYRNENDPPSFLLAYQLFITMKKAGYLDHLNRPADPEIIKII